MSISITKIKATSFVFIVLLVLWMFILLYRSRTHKLQYLRLNEELSISRMKSLNAVMKPHFIFNSFTRLQNFILKNEDEKANNYVSKLSHLIRVAIKNADSIFISFNEEMKFLNTYIKLEQERSHKKFDVQFETDARLTSLNPVIPSMVLQPYIENAITHGISNSPREGKIIISCKLKKNLMYCIIEDNGIGRSNARKKQLSNFKDEHLSIATQNTLERIEILKKIGLSDSNVEIIDLYSENGEPNGTRVIAILPINAKK